MDSVIQDDAVSNDNAVSDSDSDTNPDTDYYHPISAVDEQQQQQQQQQNQVYHNPNSYNYYAENGISHLRLNDEGSDDDEEEEERRREEIRRAFTEDERRRRAPLTEENAVRVMEAMRGISFSGSAPDWIDRVPEDQWIDRLRLLRPNPSTNTV